MKLKPSLFPAILFLAALAIQLLPGCAPSPERSRLEYIESIIDERPDSAMAMLDSVDTAALRSNRDRALYDLLYNLALYKSFNDSLDEPALTRAINVFTDCKDFSRASRSLYLLGKLQDLRKNSGEAAILLTQGYQFAKDNNDYFNQGLCAISLCEVYGKCYDSVRKTTYAKVAIDAFEKANKTDWELYAKLYLAGALITNQAFDSAMIVLKEIVSDPIAQKDPVLLSGAYDHAALTMLGAENDTMAIKYYAKAISLDENNLSDGAAQNIYALLSLNNPRISDDKDFQILIDYLRRIKPEKPFGILALEGKYKEAYDAIEVYRTEQDEFIRGIMNRSIDSTIENYHKHKNEVMAQQLKLEQKNKIIYISVFLIILIIIGLIIKHKLRKQRIRQDEIIEEAKFLSASLGNMNHKNTLLLESIRELLSKQFSIVDTICSQYYESNDKKSIAKELDKLIKDFTEDTQIINEIENDINRHYENLMTNLRAEVPTLTDNDCRLFIFAFQGFTTSSIALLLGETSKEAVYTRKSRLKTKIRKSASTNKEYYISLIK